MLLIELKFNVQPLFSLCQKNKVKQLEANGFFPFKKCVNGGSVAHMND